MPSWSFWARHPATTISSSGRRSFSDFRWPSVPYSLLSAFSRMQQVLSTITSASPSPSAASIPSASNSPAIRSESCSFIWHPKVRTTYFPEPVMTRPGYESRVLVAAGVGAVALELAVPFEHDRHVGEQVRIGQAVLAVVDVQADRR